MDWKRLLKSIGLALLLVLVIGVVVFIIVYSCIHYPSLMAVVLVGFVIFIALKFMIPNL